MRQQWPQYWYQFLYPTSVNLNLTAGPVMVSLRSSRAWRSRAWKLPARKFAQFSHSDHSYTVRMERLPLGMVQCWKSVCSASLQLAGLTSHYHGPLRERNVNKHGRRSSFISLVYVLTTFGPSHMDNRYNSVALCIIFPTQKISEITSRSWFLL